MSAVFKKVLRGGFLFSSGILGANLIQFVSGILVIRMVEPAEYGLISLAYVFINVLAILATLGLNLGLPRFMASQTGESKEHRISAAIGSTFLLGVMTSSILSIFLYLSVGNLSSMFDKPALTGVLRLFTLLIVPLVTLNILSAVFQGQENPKPKVWFVDLLQNFARLVLLFLILLLGAEFEAVLWAYIVATWLAALVFVKFSIKVFKASFLLSFDRNILKELVVFSLPLLGVALTVNAMGWTGTFVLGSLSSAEEVAFFNVPMRLVNLIPLPLVAMGYLYLPLATGLITENQHGELAKIYSSTSKWAFLLTLPLVIYFILDAEFLVTTLFGEEYREVGTILRILAIGYSVNTFVGPNGITLMSSGNSWTVFIGTLLATLGTLIMSSLLVPYYGAKGAALGTTMAFLISNTFLSVMVYRQLKIQPFSINYLKPVLVTIIVTVFVGLMFNIESQPGWIWHVVYFVFVAMLAIVSPLLTMAMTKTDVDILASVEQRFLRKKRLSNYMAERLALD